MLRERGLTQHDAARCELRVREKTYQDYEGILFRYVRPSLGERLLTTLRPLDLQTTLKAALAAPHGPALAVAVATGMR